MPADPQLHQSDIAPPPPSSSYKDKYIHGLEERIWLYKALVQKDAAIKGQITLLHEALIRATATETRRSEKLSQAVEREAKKRRVDPAISDKCSVDETPASTPDAASRSASAKVQSTRSEMREPAKQTPKTPLPLYPPGVTADTLPKAPLSSSSKDRHRSGSADNHGSAAPISRGPPSSVKKLKKKSDMRKAKDADCIPTDKVKVQPKLPKPVSVAIPKPKKKVAAAPLTTPKNLSSSAPKSKADEDAAPSAKPAKKAKSTPKNTWEFPEYIKSMVLPEVEERMNWSLETFARPFSHFAQETFPRLLSIQTTLFP